MTLTRKNTMLLAAAGSLALLLGAFVFQALGYAPCKLCIWQRWPHAAAVTVGALLFECLAGRTPHVGKSYEQVIVSICMKDVDDVRTYMAVSAFLMLTIILC